MRRCTAAFAGSPCPGPHAALRRSRYLATAVSATATLLVVDAWFDVLGRLHRGGRRERA